MTVEVTLEVTAGVEVTVVEEGLTKQVQTAAIYAEDWLARRLLRNEDCLSIEVVEAAVVGLIVGRMILPERVVTYRLFGFTRVVSGMTIVDVMEVPCVKLLVTVKVVLGVAETVNVNVRVVPVML